VRADHIQILLTFSPLFADSTNLTVDVNLSSVGIYLSPEQIKILIQFATTLIQTG